MAFPGIVLFVNVSMYFFLVVVHRANSRCRNFSRRIKTDIPFWSILFGIGAVISVIRVPEGIGSSNFLNSVAVLPNYLYWTSLVVFLNRYRRIIDFDQVQKFIFYGVTFYIPFWFVRENYLTGITIFQKTSANNLAFLMISYSPVAIGYVRSKKSLMVAILYFLCILMLMLFLGRRAGFALVLISGLFTLFVARLNARSLLKYTLIFVIFITITQIPFVEKLVENANPRIYQLFYQRDEMVGEDRSYLTRIAMIEKGLFLFNQHPISGVGLTNFHHSEAKIAGDFEGSEFVINKDEINSLSAHNSYVSALSEGGLVLFLPWIFMMLSIVIRFFVNLNMIDSKYYPLFWGFFGMVFHYTSVVGYINVYSWFIIGLCGVVLARVGEDHVNNAYQ